MDNENPKQQLLQKLQSSTNILVTVSTNPSVDQLAACLGLTLWLNKIGKHATAVFSGAVPSTLEFLQPEDTLEKTTDSLRDFIIALDKTKADKLRYKVEDTVVKIFITPYRTNLTAQDLEFSQGDFNVDMVLALGVAQQQDLDTAITAHGRILHDAAVATITTTQDGDLGSINWRDTQSSSLSELVVALGNDLDRTQLDGQIATALLTGIVAETKRFSNAKTTPQTMSVSAELMSAGANQQLVASKLDEPTKPADLSTAEEPADSADKPDTDEETKPQDGTLEIEHEDEADNETSDKPEVTDQLETSEASEADDALPAETEADAPMTPADDQSQVTDLPPVMPLADDDQSTASAAPSDADEDEAASTNDDDADSAPSDVQPSRFVTEPPTMGGTLTANSRPDDEPDRVPDPLSLPTVEADQPLLSREETSVPASPVEPLQPAPPSWMPPQPWMNQSAASTPPADNPDPLLPPVEPSAPADKPDMANETLETIEKSVDSPHVADTDLGSARDEVLKAFSGVSDPNPAPIQALNARPIELSPPSEESTAPAPLPSVAPLEGSLPFDPAALGITDVQDPTSSLAPTTDLPLPPPVTDQSQIDPELTTPVEQPFTMPLPPNLTPPPANPVPPTSTVNDPTAPPPVPPPMLPPSMLPPA